MVTPFGYPGLDPSRQFASGKEVPRVRKDPGVAGRACHDRVRGAERCDPVGALGLEPAGGGPAARVPTCPSFGNNSRGFSIGSPAIVAPMGIDPRVDIGHVHLKVADIDRSLVFYRDILGFDVMQRIGDEAAFISAAGPSA